MYDQVVLISLDTLRSDCIAANPFKLWPQVHPAAMQPRTRILDELVREGAFFPNCITAAPYTSAAHATFFSGRWPVHHGVYELFNRKLRSSTLFTDARRRGYRTIFKVDFPVILGRFLGFDRDVDEYIVEDDDAFLSALNPGRPTLAFAHFGGLHMPYGFHSIRFGGTAYREKVRSLEAELGIKGGLPTDQLVETYRDQEDLELLLRYKRIVQYLYSAGDYDRLFSIYLEGVEFFLTHRFEVFFERLLRRLAGSRFLIVLFGDHGEAYDRESYGHHNTLSEGVIRVPLLFFGPGVRSALHVTRVRSVDLRATLLQILEGHGAAPRSLDGESLASVVWGDDEPPGRPAFAQVYTAETSDYVRYQQRILRNERKTGSLRHVRYKEAVYLGNYKLVRQEYHYTEGGGIWGMRPCAPRTVLQEVGPDLCLRDCVAPAVEAEMLSMLDGYNAQLRSGAPNLRVPGVIRRQLQDMGYRI